MEYIWRAFLHTMKSLLRLGLAVAVVIFSFVVLFLTELSVERVFADQHYFQDHAWPLFLGLVVAAVLIHLLARYLESRSLVVEQRAGNVVTVGTMRASSTTLKVWSIIIVIFSILTLFL